LVSLLAESACERKGAALGEKQKLISQIRLAHDEGRRWGEKRVEEKKKKEAGEGVSDDRSELLGRSAVKGRNNAGN